MLVAVELFDEPVALLLLLLPAVVVVFDEDEDDDDVDITELTGGAAANGN